MVADILEAATAAVMAAAAAAAAVMVAVVVGVTGGVTTVTSHCQPRPHLSKWVDSSSSAMRAHLRANRVGLSSRRSANSALPVAQSKSEFPHPPQPSRHRQHVCLLPPAVGRQCLILIIQPHVSQNCCVQPRRRHWGNPWTLAISTACFSAI